jgi:protein TonB
VRVEVLTDGRPGRMWLKQSSGSGILDQHAQAQLAQWRFMPARRNGQPVTAWIDVPVLYRLSEASSLSDFVRR